MYRALFKALKGPKWLKWLQLAALAVAVIALLFLFVFPWVDSTFAEDPNINA